MASRLFFQKGTFMRALVVNKQRIPDHRSIYHTAFFLQKVDPENVDPSQPTVSGAADQESGEMGSLQDDRWMVSADRKQNASSTEDEQRKGNIMPIAPFGVFDLWDPSTSPIRSIRQMIHAMDRLFEGIMAPTASLLDRTIRSGIRTPWDVVETDTSFVLRVDMPGYEKNDIKIHLENGILVIRGEHKDEPYKGSALYTTHLILPEDAHVEEIKAELKNGVLTVVIPKGKHKEKKRLDVQVA